MNYNFEDTTKIVTQLMWLTQEKKISWKLSVSKNEKKYITQFDDQYIALVEKEIDPNDDEKILELNLKHQYNNISKYSINKMYKQSTMTVPLIEILDENQYSLWTFPYSPANEDLANVVKYSTANIEKIIEKIFKVK